ncbi:hypothetical protein FRB99_008257 [Tulasnella sp. 403]|nr:hypothetical protein FRB99_008257 [Tulasnella sp. 403]
MPACSVCQGGVAGTWSDWISFCPSSYVQKTFPSSVPPQTSVPGWATLDPTTTNLWNATAAQQAASQPSPGPKSGGGTNVGAIVGGVIGGVVGLALIGFGIWYYLQRSSRGKGQKVTPAPYVDPNYTIDQGYNNAGYVEKDTPNRMDMGTPAPMMGMPPMRPYDPADPSTFPPSANPSSASPAPTSTYVGHDMGVQGGPYRDYPEQQYGASGYPPYPGGSPGPVPTGSPGPQMHRPQPGGYTGAAEV